MALFIGIALALSTYVDAPGPRSKVHELPGSIKGILLAAGEIDVISVQPIFGLSDDDEKYQDPKVGFHGHKPLGSARVNDKEQIKQITWAMEKAIKGRSDLDLRLCFAPRHGIRAKANGKTAELLICFECWRIEMYLDGKYVGLVATSHDPRPLLNDILKKAKVPLAPGADKEEKK